MNWKAVSLRSFSYKTENRSLWDLVHKQLSILTLPMQVKHLMLLLGGGTAQSTRRRRRKVIMPLNLNSKWDQVKRDMLIKLKLKKEEKNKVWYFVWFGGIHGAWSQLSRFWWSSYGEAVLMKQLWCSSEHRCQRESESADAEAGSISKLVSPSWRGRDHAIFVKKISFGRL